MSAPSSKPPGRKASASWLLYALGTLVAVVLLTGALSGCASTGATLDPVAQAADATSAAGGAHMALTIQFDAPGLQAPMGATGTGFFNYKSREGKLAMNLTGLPSAASGGGDGPVHLEELMKGNTVYVGSPQLAAHLPGGARWIKLDLKRLGGVAGLNIQSLASGESNPAQFLDYLRAHGGEVTTVSSDTINGVQTTHYRVAVDLMKAAGMVPKSGHGGLQALLQELVSKSGLSSIPFDVWVDAQHRVRRVHVEVSLNILGQHAGTQVTLDFSGFGHTPTVTPPPDSETVSAPMPSLLGGS